MRRLVILLAVLLVGVPVAGGAVWAWRQSRPEAQAVPRCNLSEGSRHLAEDLAEGREKWSAAVGEPGAGESAVEIAEPSGVAWRYRRTITVPERTMLSQGKVTGDALDDRSVIWDHPGNGSPWPVRLVIRGSDAWMDSPSEPDWRRCRTDGVSPYAWKDLIFGYSPGEMDPTGCIIDCAFVIGPGSRVRVGPGEPSALDGEPVTTYEVRGVTRPAFTEAEERLRASITLDGERRLRAAKVWDSVSGNVLFTLEAGPAPDSPPIVDPSGGPRFSEQPPPEPPVAGTVPVTAPVGAAG